MSTLTLQQAADEVRNIIRGRQAVDQLADFLANSAGLENTVKELEQAIADRQATVAAYDEKIRALSEEIRVLEVKAPLIIGKAREEADSIIADARVEADAIISTARSNADNHEQRAIDQQAAVKTAQEKLGDITGAIDAAQADLDRLQAALANTVKSILAGAPAEQPSAVTEQPVSTEPVNG